MQQLNLSDRIWTALNHGSVFSHRVQKQLEPLTNPDYSNWRELACVALDRGSEPGAIAEAVAIARSYAYVGSEIEMWKQRHTAFERLLIGTDTNSRLARTIVHVLAENL